MSGKRQHDMTSDDEFYNSDGTKRKCTSYKSGGFIVETFDDSDLERSFDAQNHNVSYAADGTVNYKQFQKVGVSYDINTDVNDNVKRKREKDANEDKPEAKRVCDNDEQSMKDACFQIEDPFH